MSPVDDCDAQNTQCGVCLDVYADGDRLRVLPCKHRFHAICVDQWLLARAPPTCPFCRFEIGAQQVEGEAAAREEREAALV